LDQRLGFLSAVSNAKEVFIPVLVSAFRGGIGGSDSSAQLFRAVAGVALMRAKMRVTVGTSSIM